MTFVTETKAQTREQRFHADSLVAEAGQLFGWLCERGEMNELLQILLNDLTLSLFQTLRQWSKQQPFNPSFSSLALHLLWWRPIFCPRSSSFISQSCFLQNKITKTNIINAFSLFRILFETTVSLMWHWTTFQTLSAMSKLKQRQHLSSCKAIQALNFSKLSQEHFSKPV